MDASEFKDYIFGLMFLKRLSDAFEEAQEQVVDYYLGKGKSQSEAESLAHDEDEYTTTFFVPERARWANLKDLKHELAHVLHHDHSSNFWRSVASAIPNYLECREWLKHQGFRLKM